MTDADDTLARPRSAFAQLGNLFVAPSQALDYAREHPKMWWLPFCITLGLQLILSIWISTTINIKVVHAMMAKAMMQSNPEHAQQAMQIISQHGRSYFLLGMVIGVIALGVGELIYALYLFLTDKMLSAANRSFGQWFSFTAWTWLPFSIAIIIGGIVWALANHAAGMPTDPTSLNALFFHLEPFTHKRLFSVAQFSLLEIWIIALVVYGIKRWCGYSTMKSLVITLIPFIVYYGIKFLI